MSNIRPWTMTFRLHHVTMQCNLDQLRLQEQNTMLHLNTRQIVISKVQQVKETSSATPSLMEPLMWPDWKESGRKGEPSWTCSSWERKVPPLQPEHYQPISHVHGYEPKSPIYAPDGKSLTHILNPLATKWD